MKWVKWSFHGYMHEQMLIFDIQTFPNFQFQMFKV